MASLSSAVAAAASTGNQSIGESPRAALLSPERAREFEADVIAFTDGIYRQAVEDNKDYDTLTRDTMKLLNFLRGKQWSERQRYARNRPVLNKVRRHFWDSVGLLTDLSIDFQVKLFNRLNDYSEFEKLLNELAVHWAMSQSGKLEDRLYDVILYGLLHTGPAKIQWNSALMGGMGDVQMVPIAPWQWSAVGAGSDPQDAECILYFPIVTLNHIERRFGKQLAARVKPDPSLSGGTLSGEFHRPGKISADQWAKMNPALRRIYGIQSTAKSGVYDYAMLKEFWLKDDAVNELSRTVTVGPQDPSGNPIVNWAYRVEPGEPLYPRGRVITTAGGAVLEDSCNPYWDARFPFPVFRPFRVPWALEGDMVGRSWMQMSQVINRIMGGMLDAIHGILEPTLIGPKGALPPADWDAIDPGQFGGKIKYNNNAPKAPELLKRSDFPFGGLLSYVSEVNRELEMTSGASAMQQALNKKQVPGGDSLEMILSSRSLPVKVESRALASFIEDGGQMVVARQLQFYTAAHRVAILGAHGISASDYRPIYGTMMNDGGGMKPEDFVRKFTGVVRRDTLLQAEKDRKLQMAAMLLKMGKLSDETFYELTDSNFNFPRERMRLLGEARTKLLIAAAAAALTGKGKKS